MWYSRERLPCSWAEMGTKLWLGDPDHASYQPLGSNQGDVQENWNLVVVSGMKWPQLPSLGRKNVSVWTWNVWLAEWDRDKIARPLLPRGDLPDAACRRVAKLLTNCPSSNGEGAKKSARGTRFPQVLWRTSCPPLLCDSLSNIIVLIIITIVISSTTLFIPSLLICRKLVKTGLFQNIIWG